MERVAGLRPLTGERTPQPRERNKSRVPVRTEMSKPQNLRPTASPVETYVRPAQPIAGSNGWEQLAKSLAVIQPNIKSFFDAQTEAKKGGDADVNSVNAQLLPLSPEERKQAIKEGKVQGLQSLAGREAAAKRVAYDTMTQWEEDYKTNFNPATDDINAFIADRSKTLLDEYGGDPIFRDVFASQIAPFADKIRNQAGTDRSDKEMEARAGNVYDVWYNRSKRLVADGSSADEAVNTIFSEMQYNRDYLRLDYKKQQEMQLNLANQYATAGDYDLSRAILNKRREDGAYRGSLMSDPELGVRASAIMDRVDEAQRKETLVREAGEAQEQLGAALDDRWNKGTVFFTSDVTLPTESGGEAVVTPEKQAEMAGERYLAKSDAIASERGETKDQQFDRELATFSSNGVKHKTWFNVMNSATQAGTFSNLSSGNVPPNLREGYEMYKKLHGKSPTYLAAHVESKAADYYEAVRVGEEDMAMQPEQAMKIAAQLLSPTEEKDRQQRNIQRQSLQSKLDSTTAGMSHRRIYKPWTWFSTGAPVNTQPLKNDLARYADMYMVMGLGEDRALEKAQDRVKANYININGGVIRRDNRMPPNFEDLVQRQISAWVKQHGEAEGLSESDLTIAQIGQTQGMWNIVTKTDFRPVNGTLPLSTVTYRSMTQLVEDERSEEEARVIKTNQKK